MMKVKATEKCVRLIELENTIVVEIPRKMRKPEIKKEFEELSSGKVKDMRTHTQGNKKIVYIKLAKETPAIDVATKFGVI
jgi:ribosomal protein L23